uniref:Uncharacterized protein n=1 Tax=Knipowitschia caucasica TaxID=637954 RepID=A0AAV2LWQ0_KNICA
MSDEVNRMDLKNFYAWIGLRKKGSNWYWDNGHDVLQDIQDNFDPPNDGQPCGQAFYETPTCGWVCASLEGPGSGLMGQFSPCQIFRLVLSPTVTVEPCS